MYQDLILCLAGAAGSCMEIYTGILRGILPSGHAPLGCSSSFLCCTMHLSFLLRLQNPCAHNGLDNIQKMIPRAHAFVSFWFLLVTRSSTKKCTVELPPQGYM
jgi:hypothetical protein